MIDLLPPDQICRTLGSRVRARRLVANLTQAELAARAGCSLSSVRRLEGQGQATLELEDEGDILNCGIEIKAQKDFSMGIRKIFQKLF